MLRIAVYLTEEPLLTPSQIRAFNCMDCMFQSKAAAQNSFQTSETLLKLFAFY